MGEIGKPYTHPSTKQCSYAYSHPSTKQCDAASGSHKHAAGDITSGTLGTARGGTGITANPSMLVNLGSTSAASVFATSPRPGVTGTLPVARGGTGVTSLSDLATVLGSAKSQFGSYVGKGIGADNAVVITFSFKPKFFTVYTVKSSDGHIGVPVNANGGGTTHKIAIDALSSDYVKCGPLGYYCRAKFDSSANTLYFYDTREGYSANSSGNTYYWMALA